jgi:succinate-semialdehyde dehydrogenase/glutarate-semialdehyde dehydrogenase
VQRDATLSAGERRIGNRGFFYAPTVLSDVSLAARVMTEEPFGPIAACVAVADMDEGLALANSLPMRPSG